MSKKKLVKVVADVLTPVNRIDMSYKDVTARVPELTEAARRVQAGRMTQSEYAALVNALKPVKPYEFIPKPATVDEAIAALTSNKRGAYGKTADIGAGEMTDLRLDIPAYSQHGVWVNSIHRKGAPTVYGATSSVTDATMIPSPEKAMKVATGETSKAPFAVIRGGWNPMDEAFVVEQAQKYLKHKDWRQVGYDPERHGYFYDRETMSPIVSADEVIQIGPLVLAKKPKYGDPEDFPFRKGGAVNKKIDEIIAQAKQGPVSGYAPLRTRTPSQYEKDFDQYLAAQQEARQRLLTDRIPKSIDDAIAKAAGLVEGGAGALFGYGAQLPGMVGDLRELYEEYKPEGWADAPEWLKRTLTTEQIQDLLTQNLIPPEIATENFKAGTTGGNIAAIAEGVASLPQAAKVIGAGVGKGVRALAPTANQMLENYMLKTGQILPISLDAMRLAVDRKAKGGVMGAADLVGKGIKLGKEMKAAAAAREGVPDLPPAMKEGVLGKMGDVLSSKTPPMTPPTGSDLPLMPRSQGMYPQGVEQRDLQRQLGRGGKYTERMEDLLKSRSAKRKTDELIRKGDELGMREWYGTEPLRVVAMNLGIDPKDYERFMAHMASASQRNPVDKQNQMGSLLWYLENQGKLTPESVLLTNKLKRSGAPAGADLVEFPAGYGSLAQSAIFDRAKQIAAGDISGALPEDRKLGTFYRNLLGNLRPVTVDVNAVRGPIITHGDPRWLETQLVEKDELGNVVARHRPREAVASGEMSLKEAKDRPGFWLAAPEGSEYAGFEKLWQRAAERAGVAPAEAQAMGWYGSADVTALKTKPELYVDNLERLIRRTAEQTGKRPMEVMEDMLTGKGFLRKKGGAVKKKASGGLTSDDLVVAERKL